MSYTVLFTIIHTFSVSEFQFEPCQTDWQSRLGLSAGADCSSTICLHYFWLAGLNADWSFAFLAPKHCQEWRWACENPNRIKHSMWQPSAIKNESSGRHTSVQTCRPLPLDIWTLMAHTYQLGFGVKDGFRVSVHNDTALMAKHGHSHVSLNNIPFKACGFRVDWQY